MDPVNAGAKRLSQLKKPKAILQCNQCSYQTRIDHLYQRHVAKHTLDRPFQCPDCGLTDYDHSSFVDHLMDHQKIKILSCCFCKYKSNIFGMRLHMPKHRAVEPYDCSLCEFSSNRPRSLKTHTDIFHKKKFSCSYCKKIMTKYFLIKHMEKYHGVDIRDGQGKPLVAVKTIRGMMEEHSVLEDPKNGTDMTNIGAAIPAEELLHLKLPVSRVVLKRLDLDAFVDSLVITDDDVQGPNALNLGTCLGTLQDLPHRTETDTIQDSPQSPEADSIQELPQSYVADNPQDLPLSLDSDITQDLPQSPQAATLHESPQSPEAEIIELSDSEPMAEISDNRALLIPNPENLHGCIGSILPEPIHPETDAGSLEPMSPDSYSFPVLCEPVNPETDTVNVPSDAMYSDADIRSPESAIPNVDNGAHLHAPINLHCDYNMIITEHVSRDSCPDAILSETLSLPETDTAVVLPDPMNPVVGRIPAESTVPKVDSGADLPEPTNVHCDSNMILSEPLNLDGDTGMISPEPIDSDFDTCMILPQPNSPDADVFDPDSISRFNEEIDVKPDLETLMTLVPSKPKTKKIKYWCNDCEFVTAKKSLLRQHAPKHLLDQNFICTDCDFEEPNPYIFAKHLASRRSQGAKLIHCCYCDHTNKDTRAMCYHLEKHKPVKLDDCPKCGMVFSSKHNLRDHYRAIHVQKMECRECGKWMSKYSLRKHRQKHVTEKAKHQESLKPPASKTEVPKGIKNVVTGIPSKPMHGCNCCNYRTRMKSLLRRHVVKHMLPGAKLVCSLCDFTNTSPYNFAVHLKYHSGEDSYDCCFCEYSTTGINNLISHLEVHRTVHFFDCAKCDKSYTQRCSLYAHHRTYHVEKHQCTECGKIMTLSKLQFHRKSHNVHTTSVGGFNATPRVYAHANGVDDVPQALYKCDFCKYSTDLEFLYSIHTAKHAMDEAYFVCPVCQYRDQVASNFSSHMRSHSTDSAACCFCEYKATQHGSLASHLEIHRPVHFYDCSKCNKSYKTGASLRVHHRSYHVDEHTCMDCGEVITFYELLEHKKLHGTSMNNWLDMTIPDQEIFYDPSLFNCYHCSYTTKQKSLLRRHAPKHLLDARLVCPDCDFKETHSRDFAKHCVSCQGGLICSYCPFTTTELSNLAVHLETHRPVLLYDCTECPHSCYTLTYLKSHFKNLHVAEHKCTHCDKIMSRYDLKQHRLKHKLPTLAKADLDTPSILSVSVCEPGSLLCGYCDYSTDIQYLLDQHVAKHESDPDLVCPGCGFSCNNANDFVWHLKKHQLQSSVFVCCFCSYSALQRRSFLDHIESHKSIHFYDCPKCDTSCSNRNSLRSHYEKFHVTEHECPSCNAVVTYDKLLMHGEMHAEQENPTYYCDDCPYKTKKKSLIRWHVVKHLDSLSICPKCQFRESNADLFVVHLETCLQNGNACCFCSFVSTNASFLSHHLEVWHQFGPVRFFDCSKCEKSFTKSSKLMEHIRQYHKDKHRCSVCGIVITYFRLLRHMKLHKESGVSIIHSQLTRRFRCNHCVFTTKKKSLLRRHAPKHFVDNRLSCTICKFTTNVTWKFVNHLQAHSTHGVSICCFCDYSTSSKRSLALHIDQHRPVYFHDCWKCDKSYKVSYTFQQHFYRMHVQKHTCHRDKCNLRTSLYRLQKHQSQKHKAVAKEIPYYVCRGPKKKDEKLRTPKTEAGPVASTSYVMIEVKPEINMDFYPPPESEASRI